MSDETQITYTVHVHAEEGSYWAEVAELPGCFAAGDTMEELWDSLAEGVGLYLSTGTHRVTVRVDQTDMTDSIVEQRFLVSA